MTRDDLAFLLEDHIWKIGNYPRTEEYNARIERVRSFLDAMDDDNPPNKQAVSNYDANVSLAAYIKSAVHANPDMKFGEILVRLGVVDENRSTNWENERGRESWDILRRVERCNFSGG